MRTQEDLVLVGQYQRGATRVNEETDKSAAFKPIEQREWEELRFLYEVCLDTIRGAKAHQWQITYYVLAVYAGIFTASRAMSSEALVWMRWVLLVFTIGTLLLGWHTMSTLHDSVVRHQNMLKEVRKHFTPVFRITKGPEPVRYGRGAHAVEIYRDLLVAQLMGALLVGLLLFAKRAQIE